MSETTVVLHLQGELDMATAQDLRRVVVDVMAEDVGTVILDLANLTFLDSTGVVLFLATWRSADGQGRTVTLRNPAPTVLRVLRHTRVTNGWASQRWSLRHRRLPPDRLLLRPRRWPEISKSSTRPTGTTLPRNAAA